MFFVVGIRGASWKRLSSHICSTTPVAAMAIPVEERVVAVMAKTPTQLITRAVERERTERGTKQRREVAVRRTPVSLWTPPHPWPAVRRRRRMRGLGEERR